MPGERLGGFNNGSSSYDTEGDIARAAGAPRERQEVVPKAEEIVEQSKTDAQAEDDAQPKGKAALELPTMSAEEVRGQERAEVERDHEELEKAFAGLDLKIEKTPEAYAKFLQSMKDPLGEHRVYSDEQIEDLVFLYGESLSPAAGGDLDPVQPFTAVYEYEGDSSDATGVVKDMLENGSVDALAQLLGDNSLRGRVESAVEQAESAEEYNLGKTVKENIFQRILRSPVGKKVIAGVTAVAVLASSSVVGRVVFGTRNNASEVKAATEADAGAVSNLGHKLAEAVPEVEIPTPEAQEEKSILDDEHLFDGEFNLSKYNLDTMGAAVLDRFVSEDGKEVTPIGRIANYSGYLQEGKSSRYAFDGTKDFVYEALAQGDVKSVKEAIVEEYASNPQALASYIADMPGLMERIGISENILQMEDVGAQARALMGLMSADNEGDESIKSGAEWQRELVGAMYASIMHPNTTLEAVVANGNVNTFFIAPVNSLDDNVADYLPYTNSTTRNGVNQIRITIHYGDEEGDGQVGGAAGGSGSGNLNTYCGFQPDYMARKMVIVIDGVEKEIEIPSSETPDIPTPDYNEPEPPAPPEPGETPDEAIKRKNAENLQAGMNKGLEDQKINNTVEQTPVINQEEATQESVPADTTGDQTPVAAVTEKPNIPAPAETTPQPPAEPTPAPAEPAPAEPNPTPAPEPEPQQEYTQQDYEDAL